jgi:rhodanese-related sulfurtransferase
MKRAAVLLVLLLSAACAGHGGTLRPPPPTSSTTAGDPVVTSMAPSEVKALLDAQSVTVLDMRTQEEFEAGHLPGAVLVDFDAGRLSRVTRTLPRRDTYVVYSNGDNRAITAAEVLLDRGFRDLRDLVGGYPAWVAEGYPVEAGAAVATTTSG